MKMELWDRAAYRKERDAYRKVALTYVARFFSNDWPTKEDSDKAHSVVEAQVKIEMENA